MYREIFKVYYKGRGADVAMYKDLIAELSNISVDDIVKLIFSRSKQNVQKMTIRPVMIKGERQWQAESIKNNKAYHTNIAYDELIGYIENTLNDVNFLHINIMLKEKNISYRLTKKQKLLRTEQKVKNAVDVEISHNRAKSYILKEGEEILPLVDVGIFDEKFKVKKSKYDKYKQINRFVEIIADEFSTYKGDSLKIVDFGCGKSYLTFILYYYFTAIRKIDVKMIGYDLKEDVIENCNSIADKYGYHGLEFKVGDVSKVATLADVDAMISLHACDTATDYALHYAMQNKIKYIFSVPCCQHEVNAQIDSAGGLSLLLEHGLYKERFSALLTDVIRCEVLKINGYDVDVVEFVDIENTPKNSMIRAKRIGRREGGAGNERLKQLLSSFKINPTLIKLSEKIEYTEG